MGVACRENTTRERGSREHLRGGKRGLTAWLEVEEQDTRPGAWVRSDSQRRELEMS